MVARRLRLLNSARKDRFGRCSVLPVVVLLPKLDGFRILRTAGEQPRDRFLRFLMLAVDRQPVGAFDHEKAPNRHDERWDQDGRVHPPPGIQLRVQNEHEAADAGAGQRAECLEAKRSQHELAAIDAGDVLRDDHVRCRIVAAERKPEAEQANGHRNEVVAQDQHGQECDEDEHLRDEHALAAEIVGKPAKQRRTDQDAGEAGGTDDALFRRQEVEFARHERQRDAGHEDNEALEEFAGGGE